MKYTHRFLSLPLILFILAITPASHAQQAKPEKFSEHQLLTLVATAKTPAEHNRIARYYEAEAQNYISQSRQHEQMAAQFKANSVASSSKFATGTVNHCEYLAQDFKERAAKMKELEQEHERMAEAAGQ